MRLIRKMSAVRKLIAVMLMLAVCFTVCGCGAAEIPQFRLKTDFEIPENEALAFVRSMGTGWNLGNTFDASDCTWLKNELEYEKGWCGVYTTREMIQAVYDAGFRTIRMPVSWHNHVSGEDHAISGAWLDRVQQVADWAIDLGMYVIINTHHDMDKRYCYPDPAHYEISEHYMTCVWSQIAERFRDYDEHLIFESMNEPRLKDTGLEWNFDARQPACQEAADCINRLNQVFVDTVRSGGGNNETRYLMVPAYTASIAAVCSDLFVMPEDPAGRIILSVHAYTPYDFALADGGRRNFDPNNVSNSTEIGSFMNTLYDRFVKNGIPVVIGEYGARDKKGNTQDRVNFAVYYTASAHVRGIACCWWDNNAHKGSGELFGILDRSRCVWSCPEIKDAIIAGSVYGD